MEVTLHFPEPWERCKIPRRLVPLKLPTRSEIQDMTQVGQVKRINRALSRLLNPVKISTQSGKV